MLLDEPTAALDPIAESEIYHKYNQISEGKTTVFISHRLASTNFCNRIILIEDGAICEEGTHRELLDKKGNIITYLKCRQSIIEKRRWQNEENVFWRTN